jgi:hypothetical protein
MTSLANMIVTKRRNLTPAPQVSKLGALVALATIAVGAASACKQGFNTAGRLKDDRSFPFESPVAASVNIGSSGWLIIVGGGEGPKWNSTLTSVKLAAPVEAKITAEGDPGFVGPPSPSAPATFEFAPSAAKYVAEFKLNATDGSNRSANCLTQSGADLNVEIPKASIRCDKDLAAKPEPNDNQNGLSPDLEWHQKISDQIVRSGGIGGSEAIINALSFHGENVPADVRSSWYALQREVAAILERYSAGGDAFGEVLGSVRRLVDVKNSEDLANALVADLRTPRPSPTPTPQPALKACYCDVAECTQTICQAPQNQKLAGISTAAQCSAKSGTSEPNLISFLPNATTQYLNCKFK